MAAPALAASIADSAICLGVIGTFADLPVVSPAPVTAQVMKTSQFMRRQPPLVEIQFIGNPADLAIRIQTMTQQKQQRDPGAGDGDPQRIAILVLPSFSNLTLAALMEPLRAANRWAGRSLFAWSTVTERGEAIASSSGLQVVPDRSIVSIGPFDALFVVASFDAVLHTSQRI